MAEDGAKYKALTTIDRRGLYLTVYSMAGADKPQRGVFPCVAFAYNVSRQTVSRVFKEIQSKMKILHDNGGPNYIDNPSNAPIDLFQSGASTRRKGKFKHDILQLKQQVKSLPLRDRLKFRQLASNVNIPKSTIHDYFKREKIFFTCTSALKPTLTSSNKHDRMLHALRQIEESTLTNTTRNNVMKFCTQHDEVHIDEKWFFLCKDQQTYILVSDEEEPPHRTVKHKSHIAKVMFMCALAKPRRLPNGTWWDGKVGIWPIGHIELAKKASKNRPVGTPEWVSESVDRAKYKCVLLNEIIPAILLTWPANEFNKPNMVVRIQQDGAKAHLSPHDGDFKDELEQLGIAGKIQLFTQPANSPDFNINDLGFFASLQSRYQSQCPSNPMELIEMVQQCFEDYPMNKLRRLWITLQSCYNEVIKSAGDNRYKIPHMNKDKLEREGRLPTVLPVDPVARYYLEA